MHILLSWQPPPKEEVNGVVRLYLIKITEKVTNITTIMNISADRHTGTEIGGLHPHYDYSLSVSAVTILPGPYSTVTVVKTLEDGKMISKYTLGQY